VSQNKFSPYIISGNLSQQQRKLTSTAWNIFFILLLSSCLYLVIENEALVPAIGLGPGF
jgi:hypothetical protein